MSLPTPLRTTLRALRKGLSLLALFAFALLIAQCRAVPDALLGAQPAKSNAAACILGCVKTYNDLVRVESQLHVNNVHACPDTVCIALENARHDAEMARLDAAREACQNACHHQGAGTGGY